MLSAATRFAPYQALEAAEATPSAMPFPFGPEQHGRLMEFKR